MGYLYDPDREVFINENLCDENGYYSLNAVSANYLKGKAQMAGDSAEGHLIEMEKHAKRARIAKAKKNSEVSDLAKSKQKQEALMVDKRTRQKRKFIDAADRREQNESAFLSNIVFK